MAHFTALQNGAVFGRDFRVIRGLRAGGMGAVYIVEQISTGKPRALKVMSSEFAENPAARERFVLEARAASRIDSDHVVEIVTAGVDDETGAPFIVMELLKGEELADAADRIGPLPLTDVADVLTQVGHALEQAHAQGIVHRDIKPENIFLCASRRRDVPFTAKVLDFGIAKLVEDCKKTGTQPLGTPLFMAPEQTDRKGKITPATDVWALGLLAFKALTGRPFWLEAEGSLAGILKEICVDEIPPATARARELGVEKYLPPGFDAWFARCVSRSPEARFQEAGAATRAFAELVPPMSTRSGKLVIEAPASSVDLVASPLTAEFPGITGGQRASRPSYGGGPGSAPGGGVSGAPGAATPGPVVSSGAASAGSVMPAAPAPKKNTWVPLLLVPLVAAIGGGAFFLLRGKASTPADPGAGAGAGAVAATDAGTDSGAGAAAAAGASAAAGTAAAATGAGCPEGMIPIPGGKMFQGARDLTPDSKPPHEVVVSSFCFDKTEVTTAAYMSCVERGECERPLEKVSWPKITPEKVQRYSPLCNANNKDRGDHPINCVAWGMADMYCRKRGARLPTESEWEFAARGSSQRKYPWGDAEPNETYLNACGTECEKWGAANGESHQPMYKGDDGFASTAPVGSFPAGASVHGVMDLAGNVWEWTADWYAPYTDAPATDPRGPEKGDLRVLRGGDFFGFMAEWARPAYRWKTDPETYNHAIGFRCAADAKGK